MRPLIRTTGFASTLLCLFFGLTALPSAAQDAQAIALIKKFDLRESQQAAREMSNWKVPKKVIVWGNADRLPALKANYPSMIFETVASPDALPTALKDADVFIGYCIPAGVDSNHKLQWLMSMSVGIEKCAASKQMEQQKTIVTNVKKLSGPEIAEHAIALMMALNRGLDGFIAAQQKQVWDRSYLGNDGEIWELEGRTVLVVGLGGIGMEVASRAHGLGMKVIATRNSNRKGPDYVSYVGLADELLELAKKADVVINTAPLTDKTHGMFNAEFFKAMQSHAYFVSIGRGQSTNTDDLVAALKSGELAGAGLDVTDPEPLPPEHPLWRQPRVIITPHMAFRSEKVNERVWILVNENLRRYVKGDKLLSIVDLKRGY